MDELRRRAAYAAAPRIAGLRCRSVRVGDRTVWTFVALDDADGTTGLGEATLEGRHAEVERAVAAFAPATGDAVPPDAAGVDAWAAARLVRAADLPEAAAVSALAQALLDLVARRAGRPLHALLGGARVDPVPMYANVNRGTRPRTPQAFAERARRAAGQGFRGVKLAPFDGVTPANAASAEGRAAVDAALERIDAVRAAIPASTLLMVDCHWRLTERVALGLVPALASAGVGWYECPLPEDPAHHASIRRVRAAANAAGMALAGAETMVGLDGFLPLLRAGLYDTVMPDVKYVGGHGELARVARAAAAHGARCSLHNPSGPVCHAHSLHATAALEGAGLLEVQFDETPRFFSLADAGLPAFVGGASALPAGAGLGVRLAADAFDLLEDA